MEQHQGENENEEDVITSRRGNRDEHENVRNNTEMMKSVYEKCFSGNAIEPVERYMDKERMVIITAVNKEMFSGAYSTYGWFTNDLLN